MSNFRLTVGCINYTLQILINYIMLDCIKQIRYIIIYPKALLLFLLLLLLFLLLLLLILLTLLLLLLLLLILLHLLLLLPLLPLLLLLTLLLLLPLLLLLLHLFHYNLTWIIALQYHIIPGFSIFHNLEQISQC